ncbi:MAG: EAL domain-containing protein [Rhodocyclaceae bacterium]|nr:EAL domain-containing protein [Rhodocyclaceae bacterium]
MVAGYFFHLDRHTQALHAEAERDGSQLVWLAEEFYATRPELVEREIMRHGLEAHHVATALLDTGGKIVLASRREWQGGAAEMLPGFEADKMAQALSERSRIAHEKDALLTAYVAWRLPATEGFSEHWGALYLAYDKSLVERAIIHDLLRREGVVLLLALAILPFAFWLIDRLALRPLTALRRQIEALGAGAHVEVTPRGGAEICALAESINRLARQLAHAQEQLQQERALFSGSPLVLFAWRAEPPWQVLEVTANVQTLLGIAGESLVGQPYLERIATEDRERVISAVTAQLAARAPRFTLRYRLRRHDDSLVWVEDHSLPEYDANGHCQTLRGYLREIEAEIAAQQKEEIYRQVWQNLREAIMVTDPRGVIEAVNPAFTTITGYTEQEAIGQTSRLLKSGLHDGDFYADLWRQLETRGLWSGQIWNRRKNGDLFMAEMSIAAVRAPETQQTIRYIALFGDSTPLKSALERAEWSATHDRLTGLANRSLFLQRLAHLCAAGSAHGHHAAVLVFDLLRFRDINDSQGESIGNFLLSQVAQRLELQMPSEATVARLGSDEFALLLPALSEKEEDAGREALAIAMQLLREIEAPIPYDDLEPIALRAAVGIRLFHPGEPSCRMESDGALLAEAHLALIEAKAIPSRVALFERKLSEAIQVRVKTEQELRNGIPAGQLRLFLQPQRDRMRSIRGFEALVRWQHPEKGLLAPGAFLSAAETGGLMPALDDWMLDATLAFIAASERAGSKMTIACNLSASSFDRGGLAQRIEDKLADYQVDAKHLIIEITEGAMMQNESHVVGELERIASLGVRVSIDDFGTGYSSLSRLNNLPIHEMKIDRSFVMGLPQEQQAQKIIHTLIELADALAIEIVAEGVEIEAQAEYLDALAPMLQQGYFHGRPAPADEWLARLPPGEGMR